MDTFYPQDYEPLAIAIVQQAAIDYRKALRISNQIGAKIPACHELEQFFASPWGDILCMGRNDFIMEKIQKEVNTLNIKSNADTKISDYNCYNQRMQKTLADKCWWLPLIGDKIQTIIDFGCADGSLGAYIESLYPQKYIYIGVDNDDKMLQRARERFENNPRYQFAGNIEDIPNGWHEPNKTVVVMNSVIHEMYNYLTTDERADAFATIGNLHVRYIAVRDMHYLNTAANLASEQSEELINNINRSQYSKAFNEWRETGIHSDSETNLLVEFLLKYFYRENWNRELVEQYLWNWLPTTNSLFANKGYRVEHSEKFSINYLRKKWERDFGFKTTLPTHVKILYSKF